MCDSEEVSIEQCANAPRLRISKSGIMCCRLCKYKRFESDEMHERYIASTETKEYFCHSHPWCTEKFTKHELVWHCRDHDVKIGHWQNFFNRALKEKPKIRKGVNKTPKCPKDERTVDACEICYELFEDKQVPESHYETHDDQFICDVCKLGFKKVLPYIRHKKGHHEDKHFACPLCEFTTKVYDSIGKHLYTHEHFKRYKCKTCQKGLPNYPQYKEHIEYFHKDVNTLECDVCGKKFKTPHYMKQHKYQCHEWQLKDEKDRQCTVCNSVFTSYKSMKDHVDLKHRPQQTFICDICGEKLKSKHNMVRHRRKHKVDDTRHKCSHCDKTFSTKNGRIEHERIHTGEKPYECPHCEKRFRVSTVMLVHSRIHTGERPYKCHLCGKGYTCKNNLDYHLKICKGPKVKVENS